VHACIVWCAAQHCACFFLQERQAMAQEIERLQHEEQVAALEKKKRAAALMAEVAAANAQQIARKKQLTEQEREEEARIAEYIRQKDAREQVRWHCVRCWQGPRLQLSG
jgi:hypothetical protein